MSDDWKTPDDEYGQQLRLIFTSMLANLNEPIAALTQIEKTLFHLYTNYDQERVDRLGAMAEELALEVEKVTEKYNPELGHFIEELRGIIFSPSGYSANVGQLLVWAREIIARQKGSAA